MIRVLSFLLIACLQPISALLDDVAHTPANNGVLLHRTGELQEDVDKLFIATNEARVRRGLQSLKEDNRLMEAAQKYAELMAARDEMDHTIGGITLPDKAKRVGYRYRYLSENIALNTKLDGRFVVNEQWMKSTGHRTNLLSKDIADIGIGIAGPSRKNRFYYCQIFGSSL